jgi:hypothetical protein
MALKNQLTLLKLVFAWVMYFIVIQNIDHNSNWMVEAIALFFFFSLLLISILFIKSLLEK